MTQADYLRLLDWTGRQVRRDKRGSIPADMAPLLVRLEINPDRWLHLVTSFRTMFRQSIGRPSSLQQEATRRGQNWIQGHRESHLTFRATS